MSFEKLKPIPKTLDSSANNLVEEFFLPVLKETLNYDRGVGYFTSGWLSSVSEGIVPLVEQSGKIRLITSPYLDPRDYDAIKLGDLAKNDKALHSLLEKSIDKLKNELTNDVRVALSWMIADDILQLKIAIPKERLQDGDFHVKVGIFTDEEDTKIVFSGSYNDTQHANLNFEELTIFNSFNPEFLEIIDRKEKLFKRVWEGLDKNLEVYNLPEAIKNKLVQGHTYTEIVEALEDYNWDQEKVNKAYNEIQLHQNEAEIMLGSFVTRALIAGNSVNSIRQALVDKGWQTKTIDKVINNVME